VGFGTGSAQETTLTHVKACQTEVRNARFCKTPLDSIFVGFISILFKEHFMKSRPIKKAVQAGFTLVELIVVIVVLGILAAVAIPKLSSSNEAAYAGVQSATLGALKSAWSIAYAKAKTAPTHAQVAAEMADPTCTAAATGITCVGVLRTTGTAGDLAVFGVTATPADTAVIANPSAIVVITK
jgi:prepilin-type N-terminal cleavage/methylation domain-containing protein